MGRTANPNLTLPVPGEPEMHMRICSACKIKMVRKKEQTIPPKCSNCYKRLKAEGKGRKPVSNVNEIIAQRLIHYRLAFVEAKVLLKNGKNEAALIRLEQVPDY